MALNFGLGFIFGARDGGLTRAVRNLTSEFRAFGKEVLSLQRFQTMLSALSFDKLDSLGDKLKNLGTGGMELTSSLEATFAAYNKDLRKFGSTVGKTGKDLKNFTKQASSMAYGLNIGAEQAGKAIYGFEAAAGDLKAADILKKMGIDSAQTLAKFSEVTGKAGDEFSYSVMNIAKSSGIGAKEMAGIVDSLVAFGQKSNALSDSLGQIDEIGSILSKRKLLGDSPAELKKYAEGIIGVADAFYSYKQDGKKALEVATGIAKTLTENREQFQNMVAGAENALPDFISKFAMAGTGIDAAFASMRESPDQFLKNLATAANNLDENQLTGAVEFFRAHVGKAFGDSGEDIAKMLQSTEGRAALMSMNIEKMVSAAAGAAGRVAKEGFATGFTEAEKFERQQQAFNKRIRNLTTKSTEQFLKETQESFNIFAKKIEEAASQKGPLGLFVRKMADVKKFGAVGIFPADMQGPLVALGETAEALISPLAKIRAIAGEIFTPTGAIAAAAGAVGTMFLGAREKAAEEMKKSLKDSKKYSDEQIQNIMDSDIVKKQLTHTAMRETANGLLDFFRTTLPTYAGKAIKFVADFARKILSGGFGEGFTTYTGDIETDTAINNLEKELGTIFGKIEEFAKNLFKGFWAGLLGNEVDQRDDAQTIGGALGKLLRGALDFAATEISNYLSQWWAKVGSIWDDESKPFDQKIGEIFGETLPILIVGSLLGLGPILTIAAGLTSMLLQAFAVVGWSILKTVFYELIWTTFLRGALINAGSSIAGWITGTLFPMIQTAATAVIGAITLPIAIVVGAIIAFFAGMFYMAQEEGDTFSETWNRMWATISGTVLWYGAHIESALLSIGDSFSDLWWGIKQGLVSVANAMIETFNNNVVGIIASALSKVITLAAQTMLKLADLASKNPVIAALLGSERVAQFQRTGESLMLLSREDISGALTVRKMDEIARPIHEQRKAVGSLDQFLKERGIIDQIDTEKRKRLKNEAKIAAAKKAAGVPDLAVGAGGMPAALEAGMPAEISKAISEGTATSVSGRLPGAGLGNELLEVTNQPAWAVEYMKQAAVQHKELMLALEVLSGGKTRVITSAARRAAPAPTKAAPGTDIPKSR